MLINYNVVTYNFVARCKVYFIKMPAVSSEIYNIVI